METGSNSNIARRVRAIKTRNEIKTATVAIAVEGRRNRGSRGLRAVRKIPNVNEIK
jgi:hypothetical protein